MIDWNKVIEQSLAQAPAILAGTAAIIIAVRRKFNKLEENQKRIEAKADVIEQKADGNHKAALEEIKKAGKYEGHLEAKEDSRFDKEQLLKAVEQVLAAQSKQRGRRKSDPE